MRILLAVLLFIIGAATGGGAVYLLQDDDTVENTAMTSQDEVANQSNDATNDSTIAFTSQYRGVGDRNSYADRPGQPVGFIIDTQAELNQRWNQMFAAGLAPPKPVVDFDDQLVLVAMLAQKPSGGFEARIESIDVRGGKLFVTLEEKSPGNACLTTQALTRPVHVVSIAHTELRDIEIELSMTSAAPCSVPLN